MNLQTIENLCLTRVIERGTAEILADQEHAMLIRDTLSNIHFLASDDVASGIAVLDKWKAEDMRLLTVTNYETGIAAFERYRFPNKLDCYQVAYYGEKPAPETSLTIRVAEEADLPMLLENYHILTEEELTEVVRRRSILLGYEGENLVGFIGEHLEGGMGILFIFPEYRKRGFGTELELLQIVNTMDRGLVPFGQVVTDNEKSLKLQEKLGMTRSDDIGVWMWRPE